MTGLSLGTLWRAHRSTEWRLAHSIKERTRLICMAMPLDDWNRKRVHYYDRVIPKLERRAKKLERAITQRIEELEE